MVPDARQLALRARAEANQYSDSYKHPIPARLLAERVGLFVHLFTIYWSVRPCGASGLLAIMDQDGTPSLYGIDSPGTVLKYYAHAVGKGARQAKGMIEKLDLKELTCAEAIKHVAHIIHKVHDEKDKDFELEMSWLCPQSNNEQSMVPPELMKEAEEYAKAQLAAAEDED